MPVTDYKILNQILQGLPRDAFTVGFFIHNHDKSQDEWLNPLAKCANAAGMATVGILTPESAKACSLDNASIQTIMQPHEIRNIRGIDVFVICDTDAGRAIYPEESRVLGSFHGMEIRCESAMPYMTPSASFLDGWLCPYPLSDYTKKAVKNLWDNLFAASGYLRKSRHFYIIPAGYPRLGLLRKQILATNIEPDAIVYAPCGIAFAPEMGGARVKDSGEIIIKALLENFPDKKVIFRPYLPDLANPIILNLIEKFRHEKRLLIDKNPDRLFSFSRGAMMISDISSICESFAFSTNRCSAHFQPWRSCETHSPWPGHWIVSEITELISTIKSALASLPKNLARERQTFAMPADNALENIIALLKDFKADKPHADWLRISRNDPAKTASAVEAIKRCEGQDILARPCVSTAAAFFGNGFNPLAKAYSSHQRLFWRPDFTPIHFMEDFIREPLEALTGIKPLEKPDVESTRALYSQAIASAAQKNNQEEYQIACRLARGFNAAFPEGAKPQPPLAGTQLHKKLAQLPDSIPVAGFYIDKLPPQDEEWLNKVASELAALGYVTVAFLAGELTSGRVMPAFTHVSMINAWEIGSFDRINAFILVGEDCDRPGSAFPPNSRVIGIGKGVYDWFHASYAQVFTDAFLVSASLSANERDYISQNWTGFIDSQLAPRKSAQFSLGQGRDLSPAETAAVTHAFITGKGKQNWLEIERNEPVKAPAEIIGQLLAWPGYARARGAALASVYNNPKSPLLAAFALHMGKKYCATSQQMYGVGAVAYRLLNRLVPKIYKLMPNADVRELYQMAITENKARGDNTAEKLARNLLAEFDNMTKKTH